MLTVTLILSVVLLLVVPIIGLCVYCYPREGTWKPVAGGIVYLLLVQILLRWVFPFLLYPMAWFQNLVADTTAFSIAFSAVQCLLTVLFFLLEIRALHRREEPESRSVLFGFSFGLAQADLFVGFSCLSALLSTVTETSGLSAANVVLSTLEVACMIPVYMALGAALSLWSKKKDWLRIILASLALFACCMLGYMGTSIFHLSRLLIVLLLLLAAGLCLYWLSKKMDFHMRFSAGSNS